ASNGFCVTRKRRKRSRWYASISSASFPRIGKKFTRNGWKRFRIGASAARCGGDTGYRRGTGNQNRQRQACLLRNKGMQPIRLPLQKRGTFACRSSRRVQTGRKIPTRSILGFHRGCG